MKFCKTQGWGRTEIPNALISKCLASQEPAHKFSLIVGFVRAVEELNWGGIACRKKLVFPENASWVQLLLGGIFLSPIGFYGQKLRLSVLHSWKRVCKCRSLDLDLMGNVSKSMQSVPGPDLETVIYSNSGTCSSAFGCAQPIQVPLTAQNYLLDQG